MGVNIAAAAAAAIAIAHTAAWMSDIVVVHATLVQVAAANPVIVYIAVTAASGLMMGTVRCGSMPQLSSLEVCFKPTWTMRCCRHACIATAVAFTPAGFSARKGGTCVWCWLC